MTTASAPARTFTDADRQRWGGDCAITDTIPKNGRHPNPGRNPALNISLTGTRDSIQGAGEQYRTFFTGDIINRETPQAKFNFCLWNDNGSDEARRFFMTLKLVKGFRPCIASEWELHPDLEGIYEVEGEYLVLKGGASVVAGGVKPCYEVVMFRTYERYLKEMKKNQVAPEPRDVMAKNVSDIGSKITDQNVSVMEPQIAPIEHRWTPPD